MTSRRNGNGWLRVEHPWDAEMARLRPADPADEPIRRLGMSCLGRHGRWGNCVLQYAFLKCFAQHNGFRAETPEWLGRRLFDANDPPMSAPAEAVLLDAASNLGRYRHFWEFVGRTHRAITLAHDRKHRVFLLHEPCTTGEKQSLDFTTADLEGLFLVHTRHLAPWRDYIRSLYEPVAEIAEPMQSAVARMRAKGKTVVGVHIRDFRIACAHQGFDYDVPVAVYLRWLEAVWPTLDDPLLLVCTERPRYYLPLFAKYDPVTSSDLGAELPAAFGRPDVPEAHVQKDTGFFPDWHLLAHCDVMAISNSTFSFTAAMLNRRGQRFVRPSRGADGLEPFDPWNSEPLHLLPRRRLLTSEIADRVRLAYRAHGARIARSHLRGYARMYRWLIVRRMWACTRLHGRAHLMGELLHPGFYLQSGRRYGSELERPSGGSRVEELLFPDAGPCVGSGSGIAEG